MVSSAARRLQARAQQLGRDALNDLLDQNTPFGRLALTHVLSTAGDTLVTISLAGSLFFSISPDAAQSRVILYLLLTAAPFAVVAPLMGPVIDRSRGARRALVVASTGLRALVCIVMAGDIKSLLLFPLAFTMLVLSKVYLVTKGALVPVLASREPIDPKRSGRNARPTPGPAGTITGDPGAAAAQLPIAWQSGPPGVVPDSQNVQGVPDQQGQSEIGVPVEHVELSVLNAKLGLLASLAGFAAAIPAVLILKLGGASWVLYVDILVFAAAAVAGWRLPVEPSAGGVTKQGAINQVPMGSGPVDLAQGGTGSPDDSEQDWETPTPLQLLGPNGVNHPEVVLAATAMSILRGLVGFVTFLLAFELRRQHAATWWFGYMLGASTIGAVVGVLIVPRARKLVGEPQMLAIAIWLVALVGAIAAFVGGRVVQGALAFALGVAAAAGKPSFDALVQRYVAPAAQGRAFSRFETRLQLVWVIGALIPVIAAMPFVAGDIVTAAVAAVAAVTYLTGRQALRHRWDDP